MLIHLFGGVAVIALAVPAAIGYLAGRPGKQIAALAGWTLGLLVLQAATGMFLLTATEEGPGPLHVAVPLAGLALAALASAARADRSGSRDIVLAAAFSVAAAGAGFALVTGLSAG
jgi:hypothetical protein